jgi:hypothetical protein
MILITMRMIVKMHKDTAEIHEAQKEIQVVSAKMMSSEGED